MHTAFYFLKWTFRVIVFFLVVLFLFQYIFNEKYKFSETQAFQGNFIFNPYATIDSTQWKKANFHVHTHVWRGLSNGRANKSKLVDSLYRYLGYDIINISDYERINTYEKINKWYIPEYEHGYLFPKNHQLILNAHAVLWADYFFPETRDNEQYIINKLKEDSMCLVAIAHPAYRSAYSPDEFKYISGYDCMEVYNNNKFSKAHFDSALSSGHVAYLIADDDAHDVKDIYQIGRCCTLVNTEIDKDSILKALREGRAIGADIYMHNNENNYTKQGIIKQLPTVTSVIIRNDSLMVKLSATAKKFTFIGQNGTIKKMVLNTGEASYAIQKNDTYIRTEIICEDSTVYYLNPVFRYDGIHLPSYINAKDKAKTFLWRITGVAGILLIYFLFAKRRRKVRKSKENFSTVNV